MNYMEKKDQEQLFCVYMARGFSPEEAARRAGVDFALCSRQGTLLLANSRIRAKIRRLSRELDFCSPSALAKAGLTRIALGDLSGALSLLDEDAPIPANAELLGVAEIKRPKGGGVELKLFDRIRALSALAELDGGRSEASGTLLAALAQSARGLDEALTESDAEESGRSANAREHGGRRGISNANGSSYSECANVGGHGGLEGNDLDYGGGANARERSGSYGNDVSYSESVGVSRHGRREVGGCGGD